MIAFCICQESILERCHTETASLKSELHLAKSKPHLNEVSEVVKKYLLDHVHQAQRRSCSRRQQFANNVSGFTNLRKWLSSFAKVKASEAHRF
jgi:hypothetical protein